MKKWLIAAVIAGLSAGVGCETPESQQAQDQHAQSEASSPESDEEGASGEDGTSGEKAEKAEKTSGLPDDLADGESATYGGEFSVEGDPITLAMAVEKATQANPDQPEADSYGPFKVTAAVEKVCKKKGCWFTLADQGVDESVRVRMKDYSFFVPRNSDGAQAVVEGMLERRVIPQKEAQHYADDEAEGTDKEPETVEGDQVKWEMTITAAKITKS